MKNNVIRRIQELCRERNITVYKLAQLSGIPKNTLSNMIADDRVPTVPTIEKICAGLGITLSQFFTSDGVYPELTEKQKQVLLVWEKLSPGNQELTLKYMELVKEHQDKEA